MEMRWQYIVAGVAVVVVLIVMVGISRRPQPRHVVVAEEREAVVRPRPTVVAPALHERPTTHTVAPADNKTTYLQHARALEVAAEETTIPAGRATVVVTVLDRRSDEPVAELRLEGSRWEAVDAFGGSDSPRSLAPLGVVARADAPGILSLTGIPAPGRVWLRLGARGYESVDVGPVDVAGDGAVVRQVYFLSPRASVVGRVVEQQSRRPVAAARVWIAATDEADDSHVNTTTTAEDGRFELADVPSGRRYLFARAPFPAPAKVIDLSVLPGQRHDVGDVEISQRGAVVRGRVVRGAAAQPVTSATVELVAQPPAEHELARTQTDANGEFRFEGLANGPYTLNLPGWLYSRPLLLAPEEERELIVRLGDVVLRGRLLSGGKAESGSIALTRGPHGMGPARVAFAGDDGRYELTGMEPGSWTVMLWGPRAALASQVIKIPDAPVVERDFSLSTGKVVGRVVEQAGQPVAGARVECCYQPEHPYASFMTPRRLRARTAPDGSFELGPLPEGTFSVRAEHPTEGYGVSVPVAVPQAGESAPVEIRLERVRGATLRSVALSFETGAPVREAFLVLYDAAGRVARSAERNDAGVAELRGLAPGTYRMEVSASGYTADVRTITLRDGEERTVESVLATAGAARVWVEDAHGAALEGVALRLEPVDRDSLEEPHDGRSELGGLWIVRGLAVGQYRLTVQFPGGQRRDYPVVIRPRETTEVQVRSD
jgi:hypothetical protein